MTSNLKIETCCTTTFQCFNLNPSTQVSFQSKYGKRVMTYCHLNMFLRGWVKHYRIILCGKIGLIQGISNMAMVLDGGTRFGKEGLEIVMRLLRWVQWRYIQNISKTFLLIKRRMLLEFTQFSSILEASLIWSQLMMKYFGTTALRISTLAIQTATTPASGVHSSKKPGQKYNLII